VSGFGVATEGNKARGGHVDQNWIAAGQEERLDLKRHAFSLIAIERVPALLKCPPSFLTET
jgi:hypothetical protein